MQLIMSKYFKFPKSSKFFELILIFFGITLSMQFDNWNEARKERSKEKEILSSIYVELKLNQEDLQSTIKGFDQYFTQHMIRLDSCLKCKQAIEKEFYSDLYFPLGGAYLDQHLGAYENFKHNGSLLVRNNNLKIALFDYYEIRLKWIEFCQKSQGEIRSQAIFPLFINHASEKGKISYDDYLIMREKPDVIKQISIWKSTYIDNRKLHVELQPILDQLILDMEEELTYLGCNPDNILKESGIKPS